MSKLDAGKTRRTPWTLISIAFVVVLFALLVMMMPKGFKATHEEIGTGKVALVFVYDPNLALSNAQTEQMNEARAHLGDNVLFLLARVATPEGDELIAKYHSTAGEILLFDGTGKLIKRQFAVQDANQLMRWVR